MGAQFIHMENTAKNFALQLGSLISLYVSLTALITLIFAIITIQYPDAIAGYYEYESASSTIRFSIALLMVFFPAYIVLTRLVNNIRRHEHGTYLTLTKWLIYLSLLAGAIALLVDLVLVINGFLNGELTIRFILKGSAFLLLVGAAFTYYLLDARGYWQKNEKQSIYYGVGVGLVVIITLIFGFRHTETPTQVREMRLDTKQINDLGMIQLQIQDYYQLNAVLPGVLSDVYVGLTPPVASEGRTEYSYIPTSASSFKLCAEFAYPSSKADQLKYAQPIDINGMVIRNPYNWDHGAGEWCFERIVNASSVKK